MTKMTAAHPCIGFFPAIPLEGSIEIGEWVVGVPPDTTPWLSPRFKELVEKLLASFDDDGGDRFRGAALLWRKTTGFDGVPPSRQEIDAIQAAVRFASLDTNDHIAEDDPNGGHRLVTSENAALHVQPIDLDSGYITHVREGALKRVLSGGWKIGDRPPPLADATIPITLGSVLLSGKLARAVFDGHMAKDNDDLRRLLIAVEWHAAALSNPVAVTMQQRLIALKTGFEALLETSDSREAARRLRLLFETVAQSHYDLFPCAEVLWSPTERADLVRYYEVQRKGKTIKKQDTRSEVEDWFLMLAEARNKIIHEGRASVTEYPAPPERPLSRYAGYLFRRGERMLREAIKARLGADILLCGPLKRRAIFQPLVDALQERAAQQMPVPQEHPAVPGRGLAVLLRELDCTAANEVRIGRASGGASASLEVAERMANAGGWVAKARGKEVWISDQEEQLLEENGAELELLDHITHCD